MNGPSHYREAERILTQAGERAETLGQQGLANAVAIAQVHATLAMAAAAAMTPARGPYSAESDEAKAWRVLAQ